jgi:hypothetical protein
MRDVADDGQALEELMNVPLIEGVSGAGELLPERDVGELAQPRLGVGVADSEEEAPQMRIREAADGLERRGGQLESARAPELEQGTSPSHDLAR